MLEELIDSKLKIRIAALLAKSDKPISVSDVARNLHVSKSRSSECLRELENKGLLEHQIIGKSKLYSFSDSDIAKSIRKALSTEDKILQKIEGEFVHKCMGLKPVSIALFGSSVNGLKLGSDIDILVLHSGSINPQKVYDLASDITVKSRIRISPLVLTVKRFIVGVKGGEEIMINILANHKLLYGKVLETLVWQEK